MQNFFDTRFCKLHNALIVRFALTTQKRTEGEKHHGKTAPQGVRRRAYSSWYYRPQMRRMWNNHSACEAPRHNCSSSVKSTSTQGENPSSSFLSITKGPTPQYSVCRPCFFSVDFLYSPRVFAGFGIYFHNIVGLNEEGNIKSRTGFQGNAFGASL